MHENNKKTLLEMLEEAGSFDYVLRTLKKLMEVLRSRWRRWRG
jgi:hypothetical protein